MKNNEARFQGTDRFEIQRRLGAGGMGEVYQAFDRQLRAVVALKLLPQQNDPAALYRFKREFRTLADINHRNLVTLHELHADEDQWFFTMELVDGVNFLQHVRRDQPNVFADTLVGGLPLGGLDESAGPTRPPPSLPESFDRLRSATRQLAEGVFALHAAGKLHRDIKPNNVLVTSSGRVVLLDFGLATELRRGLGDTETNLFVGTVEYMAPDHAWPRSEASDWYSVGVMLYEALTGRLPFEGSALAVILAKQKAIPTAPRQLLPDIPRDLDELCMELLRPAPNERPQGTEILRRLGSNAADTQRRRGIVRMESGLFIGRESHLRALDEALAETRQGSTVTMFLHGRSGMGKTALLDRFVLAQKDAVVLQGRCYERESVPYNAVDALIDSLTRHLTSLDADEVAKILPADAASMARLFPVLRRVEALAAAERGVGGGPPFEMRRRATAALRELFTRIARARPLILTIDDLQWGDVSSASLLIELVRPPSPPPLLLLLSYRSEEASSSSAVRMLLRGIRTHGINGRDLIVGALSTAETAELVHGLLGPNSSFSKAQADRLVAEGKGNPFFVDELVHYLKMTSNASPVNVSLDHAISSRIGHLTPASRDILDILAVAGRPLEQNVVIKAAELTPAEFAAALASLRTGNLIRTRGVGERDRIEIYHDRIAKIVMAKLGEERLRTLHAKLAFALEATGRATPEALVFHFQSAGDNARAGAHAAREAEIAAKAMAYERAAELYRLALDCLPEAEIAARGLRAKLADALANAGFAARAADEYSRAASVAEPTRATELMRRGAEQLLHAGFIDEGIRALETVLAAVNIRAAQPTPTDIAAAIMRRAKLRAGAATASVGKVAELSADERLRIDACWSAAGALGMIDVLYGAVLQAQHLALALEAGEPYRVARALALEAAYCAAGGLASRREIAALLGRARSIADAIQAPHASALIVMAEGIIEFHDGNFRRAEDALARAIIILREQCKGVTFELTTALRIRADIRLYLGDVIGLQEQVRSALTDAERRGDRESAADMRVGVPNVIWLAEDAPDRAERECKNAMQRWSKSSFHLQHFRGATAWVNIALYLGDGERALKQITEIWPRLEQTMLLRVWSIYIMAMEMRGSAAAAASMTATDPEVRAQARAEALSCAEALAKDSSSVAAACAAAVRASIAYGDGNSGVAIRYLEQAGETFASAHMKLLETAAHLARGLLMGGGAGAALTTAAESRLRGQQIRQPRRFAAMLLGAPYILQYG